MTEYTDNAALYFVDEPIVFSGYVDELERGVSAVQFSLDDGKSWTAYPVVGTDPDRGVRWSFEHTPTSAGTFVLRARGVGSNGTPSLVTTNFAFTVHERGTLIREYGPFHLRAVGGGALYGSKLFRSAALDGLSHEDAIFISERLGVRSIYDIRTVHEVASSADPCIVHVRSITLEPSESRRKDAGKRLIAGTIGRYGAPGERMSANYRRYAREYPLIGYALRSIAAEGTPALVHCVNGKDRTGVLSAVALYVAGASYDEILADYLDANRVNAREIATERDRLSLGMSPEETEILDSFLEARKGYLDAFFDEAERTFGTLEAYIETGLRLTPAHQERLSELLARR